MTDASLWSTVGIPALTGMLTSGLVSGTVQLMFKARYDQRLESHKADLSLQHSREVEKIRSDGVIEAERFKKSFALMAERRAEAIEEMYGSLADVHLALMRCLNPGRFSGGSSESEMLNDLHEKRWKALDHFRRKKLFFPVDINSEVQSLLDEIGKSEMSYRFTLLRPDKTVEDWDRQTKLYESGEQDMRTALGRLETEFRRLLQAHQ